MINKVHLGDCLDVMKNIEDNSVDLIISDIPYVCSQGGNPFRSKYKWGDLDLLKKGKLFKHNDIEFSDFLPTLYRILKDKGHIYLMSNSINLANLYKEMENAGFIMNNVLVMKKNNAIVNQWYMKDCEFTIFARKGNARPLNNMSIKTVYEVAMPKNKVHPTEKPVDYFSMLINNSTKEGDIVLDPFIGSGTTAVACIKSNRNYIGIELDPIYHEIACKRIEQELSQLKLAI